MFITLEPAKQDAAPVTLNVTLISSFCVSAKGNTYIQMSNGKSWESSVTPEALTFLINVALGIKKQGG